MNSNLLLAHQMFSALDSEYHSKKWVGQEPLLSRQMKLSSEILAVFAVRKLDGKHILYLQCNPSDATAGHKYPAWKGISIEFSGFEHVGMEGCFVRIEQGEGSDDDVYFSICDDLCSCLKDALRSNLRQRLFAALERWKRFFSLRENIKLTREEQIGLFGELWLLRSMLKNGIGLQAIDSWKGPYHGVFDFSLQNMSIEVKTTAAKMPYKVFISNEMQLDERLAGGMLILSFLAVQSSDSSGETLGDVVKCIDDCIGDDEAARSAFQDKIFGCGLAHPHVDGYTSHYIAKEQAFFNIKEGFPRILSANLPNGLGDLSYSIEISACFNYKIDKQEFWRNASLHAKEEQL
ncbi:Putative PD-(D/E)XK family member [Sporobacter termitidis DSM 10068]|uniref:Putative PD-(D/E)XK family member n=1 Tax=Sporobacter termitidis DSM 10068 TaxID=1123282 RepID=A0A1M5U144_9FIRM|nr:PD-(D/E)XK motif protein [Sporobacter termitidis]SHH56757.1 Putative PD-(D/E)XK family member [Sporobacter termitidis DSM 10068]